MKTLYTLGVILTKNCLIMSKACLPKEFLDVGVTKAYRGKCLRATIFMKTQFVEQCKIYKFSTHKKFLLETIYFYKNLANPTSNNSYGMRTLILIIFCRKFNEHMIVISDKNNKQLSIRTF